MPRKKVTLKDYAEHTAGVRLSAHEKLCAERMNNILKSIEEMKREIKSLRQDVSKGKGAISVLVFFGTLLAGVIGFFTWDG
jgi:DNA-binding transcriptional LysR family regulator